MKTLLQLLFVTLIIGTTAAGCQKSAQDHNMSPEEHANMK